MSYVDKNLMAGEHVVYRTNLHWSIFGWPIFLLCFGLAFFAATQKWSENFSPAVGKAALALAALAALLTAIPAWIRRLTSEFAVTNKRVIVKVGWIQRRTIELLLTKVEAIEVMQGIGGRILNYGTIVIIGTGGTHEPSHRISAPLTFRRIVQEQTVAMQDLRGTDRP
jgi:membrane protein YdbS with pleckstrin-like domain